MATVHILTQYVWPDGAPTGVYAEQLATRLQENGCEVRLVGGRGGYRSLQRARPAVPIVHLQHWEGRRGNLFKTLGEYAFVTRAFRRYIARSVDEGDTVIVSSAPPNTIWLADAIARQGARSVYWLQDYYPELIRGLRDYPQTARRALRKVWDRQLAKWDRVIKIGENLGGPRGNAVVIRNWPTMQFTQEIKPEPRTALYSGNLGYGHDVPLLVKAFERLRAEGYRLTVRADGRRIRDLPSWILVQPLHVDLRKLEAEFLRHETHVIAADPNITEAVFPSKIWNSFAADRRILCTGFVGPMAEELAAASIAPFEEHLEQWTNLVMGKTGTVPAPKLVPRLFRPQFEPAAFA